MELPDDLYIPPKFLSKEMNVGVQSNWIPARLTVDTYLHDAYRTCIIETDYGVKRLHDIEDLIEIFKVSNVTNIFTVTPPGAFDTLLAKFTRTEIFGLDLGATVTKKDIEVNYQGSCIKLKQGHNNSLYIWNLWKFFNVEVTPPLNTIASYCAYLVFFLRKHHLPFPSLHSPSSVARHNLIRTAMSEFISDVIDRKVVNAFYAASRGGRQESVGIGAVECHNYDMNKAHLSILSTAPSIRGCQFYEDFSYIKDAAYGVYLIKAQVPKMDMCPLPVESKDPTKVTINYPYGEVSGWYSKPYIDLVISLGINFEVIKSYQYVPVKYYPQPFSKVCSNISAAISSKAEFFNAKGLYYGIAGSTISWRYVIDESTGELYPRSFSVFSPMIYSHVLGVQAYRTYKESQKGSAVAIRSDAVTVKNKIGSTFKLESKGPTIFVTSLFKAFPGERGEYWRDLIRFSRDNRFITIPQQSYPTLKSYLETGVPLGVLRDTSVKISPGHGSRIGNKPKRVGELMDTWFKSEPMEASNVKS